MKLKRLSFVVVAAIGLSACQLTTQQPSTPALSDLKISPQIQTVLAGSADIMAPSTSLYTTTQFDIAANQLLLAAQNNDIEKSNSLLYFLGGLVSLATQNNLVSKVSSALILL